LGGARSRQHHRGDLLPRQLSSWLPVINAWVDPVTLEDDGVGLQPNGTGNDVRREGLGLVGIRERVSDLGGTFRIAGNSGKGTRLTIELPLC
jgi:glucose-6-phosphate-specific signal transduction histidine kinase